MALKEQQIGNDNFLIDDRIGPSDINIPIVLQTVLGIILVVLLPRKFMKN